MGIVTDPGNLTPLATFCRKCGCGCPQLFVDPEASEERRIVITDDLGQQVRMSTDQFASLVIDAEADRLDVATIA